MLLTDARRPARTRPDGALVPLAEQDRRLWDRRAIAEGVGLVTETLARVGDTDWRRILGCTSCCRRSLPDRWSL